MTRTFRLRALPFVLMVAILTLPVPVQAHTGPYRGHTDCGVTAACPVLPCPLPAAFVYHCFPGGHLVVDADGLTDPVFVEDEVFPAVGAYLCQDNALDALICGGPGEYSIRFCHSTSPDEAEGWDPALPLYVFVGGFATTFLACNLPALGFRGFVGHA